MASENVPQVCTTLDVSTETYFCDAMSRAVILPFVPTQCWKHLFWACGVTEICCGEQERISGCFGGCRKLSCCCFVRVTFQHFSSGEIHKLVHEII
uniref:Uncharacterized protein n=1 Tax=Rhipicephalus zambeziensis TaxID=60191 RepID=A0A224Y943_9ACAR